MAASSEAPTHTGVDHAGDDQASAGSERSKAVPFLRAMSWRRWPFSRLFLITASLLGCQAIAASQRPLSAAAILLADGPARARVSFLQGFQLGDAAVRACGLQPVSVDWRTLPWDSDPGSAFPSGMAPPLLVAPFAADLRAFAQLAESSDSRVLLPFQRGTSLQGLKALESGTRFSPLLPSRDTDLQALAQDAIRRGWTRMVVVSDPGTIEADAAAPFISLVQGDGGQVLSYTDALVQEVDPADPDRLRLLAQDLAWLAPDALVMAAPPQGRLAKALRRAQRDGAFAPADPAWIWPLAADQVTELKEQPWPQLALRRPAVGPGWESFARRFQERYGQPPTQLAGAGYDTARLLALASVAPAPVSSEGTRDPLGWMDPEASPLPLCEAIARRRAGQAVRLEGVNSGLDLRPAQAPSGEALTRLIAAQ